MVCSFHHPSNHSSLVTLKCPFKQDHSPFERLLFNKQQCMVMLRYCHCTLRIVMAKTRVTECCFVHQVRPILLHCMILCFSTISLLLFHSPIMLYLASFFYGFVYSVANIGLATMTKDLFGKENYSKTYPTFSMFGTIGSSITASGIGYIYDYTHSYSPILIMILTLFILNTIFVLYCYRNKTN